MKKRILSAFLLVVMLISLFPVQAFAAETTENNSGVLTDVENNEANPSEDELPGEEVDILPLPEEEYEDAIEEPSGEPEAELTEISETPDETKDETEGETENAEESVEKFSIRFNLTPADLTLEVYSADEAQAILPEADGSYLLIPGEYYYDAECEGYVPALGVDFTVVEDAAIDIVLEADSVSSVMGGSTSSGSNTCGVNLTWTLDSSGTLTISGTGKMYDYNSDSAAPWTSDKDKIKSVKINSGVESIGDEAFGDCSNLASVDLGSGLKSIGAGAFYGCAITSLNIPDSLESIGYQAFIYCPITSLIIPDSVTDIGAEAFYQCSLESVTIGDGVKSIGDYAFYGCNYLTSLTIGEKVESIGIQAFLGCWHLTNVTIPDSVTSIGDLAFSGCSELADLTIPVNVASIGKGAFEACNALTSIKVASGNENYSSKDGVLFNQDATELVIYPAGLNGKYTIPDGVEGIGDCAFSGCTGLTSVTIPDSVTSIGEYAFYGCGNLSDVYYTGTEAQLNDIEINQTGNDVLSNATLHYAIKPQNGTFGNFTWTLESDGTLTISGSGLMDDFELTGEGDSAVSSAPWASYNYAITSVVITGGVNSIAAYAFYGCGNLKSVTIPDTVCTIGESAFKNCAVLTDVYYDGALSQWGYISKFSGNDALLSTTVHAGYMIAYYANGGDSAPEEQIKNPGEAITLSETIPMREGYKFLGWKAYTRTGEVTYQPGDAYTVDEDIYLIAMWRVASGKCGDNVSFTLDDSGTLAISGSDAIYDYTTVVSPWHDSGEYITAITVGEGVTSIGAAAFGSLENLKSISLPSSLEKIGDYAIAACTSLTTLTIPENVSEIGIWAFTGLWSLKELNIPGSVEKISDYAFAGCNALEKLTINSGTKEIGKYAFTGCTSITELTLPEGLETVDEYAFNDCEVISTLTLPASIKSIGVSAFNNCGIKSVYFLGTQTQWDAVTKGENNESLKKVYTGNLISYDANGGESAPEKQIKQYGKALKLSTDVPMREHYTFLGWAASKTAASAQYKSGASYTKNADITLYAVWKPILITKITVTPSTYELTGSTTLALGYSVLPETAADAVTWKSSNEKIAVVDENGVVTTTGTAYGTVTITATAKDSGKKTGKCTLTVKSPLIETLTIKDADDTECNGDTITLPYISGSTYQYIAEKAPADSASKISWKSSSTKVAAVNASGLLTVKGVGTATITAKSADTNAASASFTVNVVNYTPTLSAKSVKINSFFNSGVNISVTCAENSTLMSLKLYTKVRSAYVPLEKIDVKDMGEDGYCLKAVEAKKASYSAYAKVTVNCDGVGEVDYYLPLRIAVVNTEPTVKITLEKINPFYVDRAWNVTVTVTNGELKDDSSYLLENGNGVLELNSDKKLVLTEKAKNTLIDNPKSKLSGGALEFIVHFKDTENTKTVSVKPSIAVSTPKFTARDVSTGKTLSYVTFNNYFNADTAKFELYDNSSKSVVIPQECAVSDPANVFDASCTGGDGIISLTCNDYDAKKSKATLEFSSDEWLTPVKLAMNVKYAAAPKMTLSASGKIDLIDRENTGITYTPRITNGAGSIVSNMQLDSVTNYNKEDAANAFDFSYDLDTGKATLRANDGYALLKKAYTVKISATLELNGETCDASATVKVTPTQSTLKLKASAVKMKQGETLDVAVSTTPAECELESATVTVPAKASGLTAEFDEKTKLLTLTAGSDLKLGTYTITVTALPKNAVSGTAAAKLSLKVTVTK